MVLPGLEKEPPESSLAEPPHGVSQAAGQPQDRQWDCGVELEVVNFAGDRQGDTL